MSESKVTHRGGDRAKSPKAGKPNTEPDTKDANEKIDKPSGSPVKKYGMLIVVAVILYVAYKYLGSHVDIKGGLEKAVDFVEKQGNTAVFWYVGFTFAGVICLIPTTPMEIAGGFLFINKFGYWVYVFTGCAKLCANVVSVLIARFLVKDYVMKHVVEKSDLLKMVASAVKDEPWKMAFLVRGSMVPLFVKNYGLGVTDIGYLPNACCSLIFTNFYAAQNIYMGSTMQNLKEVFAPKKGGDAGPKDWTATAKSLMPVVFNVLLVVCLVRALKSQFKKQREALEKNLKEKGEKKAD
jgi:uncharacterized membrane protein YdjX (TVP38/TMEM64 family)